MENKKYNSMSTFINNCSYEVQLYTDHMYFEAVNVYSNDVYLLNVYPVFKDINGDRHIVNMPIISKYLLYTTDEGFACSEFYEVVNMFEYESINENTYVFYDDALIGHIRDESRFKSAKVDLHIPGEKVRFEVATVGEDEVEIIGPSSSSLRFVSAKNLGKEDA